MLETKNWRAISVFNGGINGSSIELIPIENSYPKNLEKKIQRIWNTNLEKKKRKIKNSKIKECKNSIGEISNALYLEDKKLIWSDPLVGLIDVKKTKSKISLLVEQISYKYFFCLEDKEVFKVCEQYKIQAPAPLAAHVYPLTLDNKLVLTIRGDKVSFPGNLYGIGGGLELVTTSLIEVIKSELEDEVLIEDYQGDIIIAGILEDKTGFRGSVSMPGWLKVNFEYSELKKKVLGRSLRDRPNDAINLSYAPASESELFDYLLRVSQEEFVPTGHGGLIMFGFVNYGKEWASKLLNKINSN